ncbi:cactus-binding C-terminus of cactin protein-domain-containing protein [Pelagophyceae sp. CCMP2097]|nr:cactus-binding C-terminus of cactin protein-domain-containing protein [Pelagophyceae sp. CCMP2097]
MSPSPERGSKKRKKEKAPKLYEQVGYTNDDNPFGDADLGRKFVWKKKDADKTSSKSGESSAHYLSEIEKVRKRRKDREDELAEMERLRDEEARLREAAQYSDWQGKEEEFHLEQTKVRSRLRLANHRSQPIDCVAKNMLMIEQAELDERRIAHGDDFSAQEKTGGVKYSSYREDDRAQRTDLADLDVELREPRSIVAGITGAALVQLRDDALAYADLEGSDGKYVDFWRAFVEICDCELGDAGGRRGSRAVHGAVAADVRKMLEGKSVVKLDAMIRDVQGNIDEPDSDDDESPEYWHHVLREARLARAAATLSATHADLLQRQLALVTARRADLMSRAPAAPAKAPAPEPVAAGAAKDSSRAAVDMAAREADRGTAEDEEVMVASAEVEVARPAWADKYEPRKPRYLNRIRTGYEWNKYNQTHYTHEEPPPKIVQGYKFNLFYPDLIDRTHIPTFTLEKDPAGGKDFAILRFTASPPYEDVAFKVVNQEWEHGPKKGYRCVFERGILQLHFNFKRWRYRR